jgi:hypothetical protein
VVINWNEVVARGRPVRSPGFYLKGSAEVRDYALLAKIKVTVFPEVTLLRDFVKSAAIVFEESPGGIYTVPCGDVLA